MRRFLSALLTLVLTVPLYAPPAYAATTASLKVGVVRTVTAANTKHYLSGKALNGGYYDTRVDAVCELLEDEGFTVDTVDDAALGSLSALQNYDALVFPRTLAMTPAQRKAVIAYAAEGGGVVGSFGMSRWDYNKSYTYGYKPFLGMSGSPGVYTWPPSSDALKVWEWGEVSEMYNVKFKNDPLMYSGYTLSAGSSSSHWILGQTQAEAGSRNITVSWDDYNESCYSLSGASNFTPLYTYSTRSNSSSADDSEHGYLAGWTTDYYFGRFVYFGFQLHDLIRGGIYTDSTGEKVAERLLVNSVKWAAASADYRHVPKRVTLSGSARYSSGRLSIDTTVKNTGSVSLRGPLRVEVRSPSGTKVYSGQAHNNLTPLPPGSSYTHGGFQAPISRPTAGTWTVKITYQFQDHLHGGTMTATRVLRMESTGASMRSAGMGSQTTAGGAVAPTGIQIAGSTRYDTAIELSKRGWPGGISPDSKAVILATGLDYPDALAAGPLAGKLDAPVLLLPSGALPASVSNELKRLYSKESSASVYVVGGTGAVSNSIVSQAVAAIKSGGTPNVTTERLSGLNRWETAAAIAGEVGVPQEGAFSGTVFIANGQNYPDALAISALAAKERVPILLVSKTTVPPAIIKVLDDLDVGHATILGGTGVIGTSVESWLESNGHRVSGVADGRMNVDTRLGGATRYDTGLKAVEYSIALGDFEDDTLYVATGTNWPDALALASLAGKDAHPVVLLNGNELGHSSRVASYLISRGGDEPKIRFVGGAGAISDYLRGQVRVAIMP